MFTSLLHFSFEMAFMFFLIEVVVSYHDHVVGLSINFAQNLN